MSTEDFKEYVQCECGAVTLYTHDGREYSCKRSNLKRYLPDVDLRKLHRLPACYGCNHCINHYGLDLCACGSGEHPKRCRNGYPECGHPMQSVEEVLSLPPFRLFCA